MSGSRRRRILLVDHLADNLTLLSRCLGGAYDVVEAADCHEALAAIASQPPDLLLIDLAGSTHEGLAVLAALSAGTSRPPMPVIAVAEAADRDRRQRALALGADELLSRPIAEDELLTRVRTLLACKEARDELAQALEREQFQRAEVAQLKEMDRLKDEFLSVVSHELRTPLNFIMGFATILDDEVAGELNPEQHAHMAKIIDGSERMLGLVNDLLEFAKLRSGKFSLEPLPVSYRPLVENVLATMRPLADQKRIALSATIEGDPVAVLDALRVVQVLTNLVGNAVKFTPPGGSIGVRVTLREGAVLTEVADTGIGIAPENQEAVFESFRQVDMSPTGEGGGTGLGLAISQAIVEAHGGVIGVQSVPGCGSTFWYLLPLAPVDAAGAADSHLRWGAPSPPAR
ncbi:MAG: ATP-binding protein [Candidatus Sericytochromatia bacterium]